MERQFEGRGILGVMRRSEEKKGKREAGGKGAQDTLFQIPPKVEGVQRALNGVWS